MGFSPTTWEDYRVRFTDKEIGLISDIPLAPRYLSLPREMCLKPVERERSTTEEQRPQVANKEEIMKRYFWRLRLAVCSRWLQDFRWIQATPLADPNTLSGKRL
jgi:hypothetical protein